MTDSFRIAKTTNGGLNWQKQYQLSKARDIFFLNPNTGWMTSEKIYKTTNAGLTWFSIRDSLGIYYKVKFINENTGWCYGSNNKIFITHNGGSVLIKKESDEIPDNFSLGQNYPNPFNPATKIKFNVTRNGFIKLIVYDMNGKAVSTLVNGDLSAGIYSVDFDRKNLSGGIYFYRMEANGFKEVKKMVLVK